MRIKQNPASDQKKNQTENKKFSLFSHSFHLFLLFRLLFPAFFFLPLVLRFFFIFLTHTATAATNKLTRANTAAPYAIISVISRSFFAVSDSFSSLSFTISSHIFLPGQAVYDCLPRTAYTLRALCIPYPLSDAMHLYLPALSLKSDLPHK